MEKQEKETKNKDDLLVQMKPDAYRIMVLDELLTMNQDYYPPLDQRGDKRGAWGLCQKGGLIPESNWVESRGFE